MFFGFSLLEWKFPHFSLKTSADHKEHALKAEGKKPQTFFLPSNHDYSWKTLLLTAKAEQRSPSPFLSYQKFANLLSRPLENVLNPCVPGFCEKQPSTPKTSKLPVALPVHGSTDQIQLKNTEWTRYTHLTQPAHSGGNHKWSPGGKLRSGADPFHLPARVAHVWGSGKHSPPSTAPKKR